MTPPSFKSIGTIALALSAGSLLNAETVTDPVGVVKITIAAAPSGGTKLTAISATLRNSIAYHGTATSVGSYNADAGSNPPNPDQPITQTGAGWTTNQWTTEPHLCYIENAAGAEEAYLIKSHTADTLTLATSFDFSTRYSTTPTFRIVKANTLGGIFGTLTINGSAGNFHGDDRVFLWGGSKWDSYYYDGSQWVNVLDPFTSANNTVVFPSEGIFVKRTQTSPITATVNGSVPVAPQISTLEGPGLTFISSNYPIGTTLGTMAIQNTNAWGGDDRLFIWDGTKWDSFLHDGSDWYNVLDAFTPVNDMVIEPDSAILVKRVSTSSGTDSSSTNPLPYTP